MKQKLLICGGTGFIGRNLATRLADQGTYEVYATCNRRPAFSHPGVQFVQADLLDKNQVARVMEGMDLVVLSAATTSGAGDIANRPHIHITDNVILNSLVLRAAWEAKIKHLVFFSCTLMYQSQEQAIQERDFDANAEMYPAYFGGGWMKVYIEKQAEFFARLGGTRFTLLRHSNIYGPHDKYDLAKSHVFGATVTKVMTNQDGKLTVWGTGAAERDLLHVDDLCSCVETVLERQQEPFALFNVGSGRAVSVADLVKMIIQASGKSIEISFDTTKPDFKTKVHLDCGKIKAALGWEPNISLETGIQKTLAWYRDNLLGPTA